MKTWYNYPRVKDDEQCRFCRHRGLAHMEVRNFGTPNMQSQWDLCMVVHYQARCKCPGFAPADNLKYLEMKHDESSAL